MGAIAARELIVTARRAAAGLASGFVAGVLLAFVVVWPSGVPVLTTMDVYEQAWMVHWTLLVMTLPWTAARSASREHGNDFVLLTALTGRSPGEVVAGKILAMFAVLMLVALAGLPALVIAQQAAAIPMTRVVVDLWPLAGMTFMIAVSSTVVGLIARDALRAWLSNAGITIIAVSTAFAWTAGAVDAGVLCASAAAIAAPGLCTWSNRSRRYLGAADAA